MTKVKLCYKYNHREYLISEGEEMAYPVEISALSPSNLRTSTTTSGHEYPMNHFPEEVEEDHHCKSFG